MLKELRNKKTAKKIWIILIILIVPAFTLWGFGSFMHSKQEAAYVGKISSRKVSSLEYQDALDAVKNQAVMQFGDDLSKIQKYLNLESQAWERLILLTEAKKRKVKVSDKEVIELIKSYPFFKNRQGRFDNHAYSEMLRYVFHAQPRTFEEQTRQNIMLSKLYKEVTEQVKLSDEEIKKEYQRLNEKLSLYYIASQPLEFAKSISPGEEEIKDYFTKKSIQFKQPLSFNLEYVSLALENKDEGAIQDEIKKMVLRLNKKEDFIKAAKDFNLQVKETGLFSQTDPIPGIGWSPQILGLLEKVKVGEYLPPIKMDKYYYILRFKERKEPYVPNFDTTKDKVKEAFIKDKSGSIARQKIEDCLKELKTTLQTNPESIDFDKTAKVYGLKSGSTDTFQYGSYIEGIGASDTFWMRAQNLKEDSFSEIIEMDPAGFYIIKLKSKIPIDEKKFGEEKTEFTQKLLAQKKQEYFTKYLEELKKKD